MLFIIVSTMLFNKRCCSLLFQQCCWTNDVVERTMLFIIVSTMLLNEQCCWTNNVVHYCFNNVVQHCCWTGECRKLLNPKVTTLVILRTLRLKKTLKENADIGENNLLYIVSYQVLFQFHSRIWTVWNLPHQPQNMIYLDEWKQNIYRMDIRMTLFPHNCNVKSN